MTVIDAAGGDRAHASAAGSGAHRRGARRGRGGLDSDLRIHAIRHPASRPDCAAPASTIGRLAGDRDVGVLLDTLRGSGPAPEQHALVDAAFRALHGLGMDFQALRRVPGVDLAAFETPDTLLGFICQRPHGHHGDYETLDRIYTRRVTASSRFAAWDRYAHGTDLARGLRGREAGFKHLLEDLAKQSPGTLRVLDLGAGPCRAIAEFLDEHPEHRERFEFRCVEHDVNAVHHARILLGAHASRIRFAIEGTLRFQTLARYDLVWAAGLLDALPVRSCVRALRRICRFARPGGLVVTGHFADGNRSRCLMEFCGWSRPHHSRDQLLRMASAPGLPLQRRRVTCDQSGAALLLHLHTEAVPDRRQMRRPR